jgi:hypothetical protein
LRCRAVRAALNRLDANRFVKPIRKIVESCGMSAVYGNLFHLITSPTPSGQDT